MPPARPIHLLTLALALALLTLACGPTADRAPTVTPTPEVWRRRFDHPPPTPTGILIKEVPIPPPAAALVPPTLEEQVFFASVIVRATLQSVTAGVELAPAGTPLTGPPPAADAAPTYLPVQVLRFTVHEYLKGSGPTGTLAVVARGPWAHASRAAAQAAADAAVAARTTTWDDREGVLFLDALSDPYTPAPTAGAGATGGGPQATATSAGGDALGFSGGLTWDAQAGRPNAWGYAVDTNARAWLPARDAPAAGAEGVAYITDGTQQPPPVVTLAAVKAEIAALAAALTAGEGIAGYEECLADKLTYGLVTRAQPYTPIEIPAALASGTAAGIEVYKYNHVFRQPQYNHWWLSEPDAMHFQAVIDDADTDPANGYESGVATARPLPAGSYRVHHHPQGHNLIPCNFKPDDAYLIHVVQVTAPAGTVHEAFFDPVAIGNGVGADDANGALEPAAFSVGETAVSLQRLSWEANQLHFELSAAVALADHYLDFIALDGSVALRLALDDATTAATDAGGQAWRWRSCALPWAAGDQLMLRLHHSATALPDVAAAPGCGPPPTFSAASYAFSLAENTAVGAAVGTVTATGAGDDPVSYSITAGNDAGAFALDATSGVLTVAGALDYESTASYALTVTASEADSAAATAAVTVAVTDVSVDYDANDDGLIEVASLAQLHAMRWDLDGDGSSTAAGHAVAFPEASAGMGCPASGCVGYELTADLDVDTDGSGVVDAADDYWNGGAGWAPIGGQAAPFSAIFHGNGHAIAHLFIDRPGASHVGVFGGVGAAGVIQQVGLRAMEVTGRVNVGGLVGFNEGTVTASYAVGRVAAARAIGGGLVGRNDGAITASHAGGQAAGPQFVGGLVGVNSGRITASYATGAVAGPASGPSQGHGGLVGRNSGAIAASYARGTVAGGTAAGGLVGMNSGQVGASYWDTAASGQVTSAGGTGKTTSELQAPTGYAGIYAAWNVDVDGVAGGDAPWEFGAAAHYPVLRVDFDGDGTATWEEFGAQHRGAAANRAPVFAEGATATRAVAENTAAGEAIGAPVTATDADGGDVLTYALSGADAASFELDTANGQLRTKAALDHETRAEYVVTVEVSDPNGGRATIAVTIAVGDVVDRPPAPANLGATPGATSVALTWDAIVGAAAYRVEYRTHGAGTWATDDAALTTPAHTVTELACDVYEFVVSAYGDGITHTAVWSDASAIVTAQPTGCGPEFDAAAYAFTVPEDAAPGTVVGTVTATVRANGAVSYAITAGNAEEAFAIDADSGAITVAGALDHETTTSYALTVSASHGVSTTTAPVTITVTDVVEPPVFAAASYAFSVAEDAAAGATVGTVSATAASAVSYAITAGNAGDAFAVNASTGALTVAGALDHETTASYVLTVSASQPGSAAATVPVTVTVTNVVEPLGFGAASYAFSVAENVGIPTTIGTVTATDPEGGDVIYYDITAGNEAQVFAVDALAGRIVVGVFLDYEATASYTLTVRAVNGQGDAATVPVTITVTDVDEPPAFGAASYTFSIADDAAEAAAVGTVTATVRANGTVSYAITAGNADGTFAIDADSGAITVAGALDHETTTSYALTVTASHGVSTTTAPVTITVTEAG